MFVPINSSQVDISQEVLEGQTNVCVRTNAWEYEMWWVMDKIHTGTLAL